MPNVFFPKCDSTSKRLSESFFATDGHSHPNLQLDSGIYLLTEDWRDTCQLICPIDRLATPPIMNQF
jgi:hypothetical protein